MQWKQALLDFRIHLKLERALSDRTVDAYIRDLGKLRDFAEGQSPTMYRRLCIDDLGLYTHEVRRADAQPGPPLSAVRASSKASNRTGDHG